MPKGQYDRTKSAAAKAEASAPEAGPVPVAVPVPATEAPFMVKATMGGTYPDPDSGRARWRNIGDVFPVKCQRDFSHRWMQRLGADEIASIPDQRTIPQTTAKVRKPNPFPQMV